MEKIEIINKIRKVLIIVLVILLISITFLKIEIYAEEPIIQSGGQIVEDKSKDPFKDIEAPEVLLGEANKINILYEKQADEKIYPASVTKLMTAILVAENCELDEIVTVSENAVHSVPSGYVNANLQVGEQLTVEDLMYAMLIPSANDVANVLAEYVGGSIESFATMMNTRAKELGCTGSNFTNPSGLHQDNHYTTTRDLYFIAKEAYSKNIIKKVISTITYTLPSTNKYTKELRIFTTTNYMKQKSLTKYYCDYCMGGKTGYTGEAKNCVIEYAQKNEIELIAIVMGENAKVKGQKFLDAKKMLDYAFEKYENKKIVQKNNECEVLKINNATKETKNLKVLYKEDIKILEKKDVNILQSNKLQKDIEYTNIKAPISKESVVGKITYKYNGMEYSSELIAKDDVEESKKFGTILKVLIIVFIIYIIYNFKKSNNKRKKIKKLGRHGGYK